MGFTQSKKLIKAARNLEAALDLYKRAKSELHFLTVVKSFEVTVEYAWRDLKRIVEDEGVEAQSPKMAVKQAARLKMVKNPKLLMMCIDARNNSVHDYFGISEKEFVELSLQLLRLLRA